MRKLVAPAGQLHQRQVLFGDLQAGVFVHAANLQRHGDVVQHRAVRHQREVLKHHGDAAVAKILQLLRRQLHHIAAADINVAAGRLQQTVDVAHQRGFAAAGQPHDAVDLAPRHFETHIGDADDAVVSFQRRALGKTVVLNPPQRLRAALAENFPGVADANRGAVTGGSDRRRRRGRVAVHRQTVNDAAARARQERGAGGGGWL